MSVNRVILGGLVGGVVMNVLSAIIHIGLLERRYAVLQSQNVFRTDPRLPFLPLWMVLLFAIAIGLTWLYAAARGRLGPGPRTALSVGLVVGLVAALPSGLSQFSWSYAGGVVVLWNAIDTIAGCALGTLAGGWIYKE